MKKQIPFFLSIFFISLQVFGQDLVPVPSLEQRVTDLTSTLSQQEVQELESRLKSFEDANGSQVAVLIVSTTGDEAIEQYSIRVVDEWKLGRGNVDDGTLLLVAMNDRKMRIEVGYGLEGALTDALSKRIISNVITPEFRSGHFYQGISDGLDVILSAIKGEELPPAVNESSQSVNLSKERGFLLTFILFGTGGIFGLIILNVFLRKKLGKSKGTLITVGIIFLVSWMLFNLIAAFFITLFGSIFFLGGSNRGGGRGGGFYGGYGGGGFSSGGGFSGGGFSGGGGGFGGGGASGGW